MENAKPYEMPALNIAVRKQKVKILVNREEIIYYIY